MSASAISLVVGLGNPGREYEATRHNAGFWWVDAIAAAHGASWSNEKAHHGQLARFKHGGRDVWLLKPQTYMNKSGVAVASVMRFYKISLAQVLVAHDELDILPGEVRVKVGGGTAGHNGLKDIAALCGGPNYARLRLGIGHPRSLGLNQGVADFVLARASAAHQAAIDAALSACIQALPQLLNGEFDVAVRSLHSLKAVPIAQAGAQ